MGIPLPGGHVGYFAPDYPVARCCPDSNGFPMWMVGGAGDWSTAYNVPTNATYWTEIEAALELLPACGGWRVFDGTTLWKCKTAQRVGSVKGENWGRPAGWRDRYSIDESLARCIVAEALPGITIEGGLDAGLNGEPCYVAAPGLATGIYKVSGRGTDFIVGDFLYAAPEEIDYDAGTGLLAPLRWPDCWPILGKARATATCDGATIAVTTRDVLYLRSGDDVELDGTGIHGRITVTGDKEFTLVGATVAGFTGMIFAHGAPLEWMTDKRRGTAVYVHNTSDGIEREQVGYAVQRCNTVLCISDSPGDVWPNMVKRPVPQLVDRPGAASLGVGFYHPYMVSVFAQDPHPRCITKPDESFGASECVVLPDDGSCLADTCGVDAGGHEAGARYHPPIIREAVLAPPDGAPVLPIGVHVDTEAYTLPGFVALTCAGPVEIHTPWGLYNAMRASACARGGDCRFRAQYYSNGVCA